MDVRMRIRAVASEVKLNIHAIYVICDLTWGSCQVLFTVKDGNSDGFQVKIGFRDFQVGWVPEIWILIFFSALKFLGS